MRGRLAGCRIRHRVRWASGNRSGRARHGEFVPAPLAVPGAVLGRRGAGQAFADVLRQQQAGLAIFIRQGERRQQVCGRLLPGVVCALADQVGMARVQDAQERIGGLVEREGLLGGGVGRRQARTAPFGDQRRQGDAGLVGLRMQRVE